MAAASAAAAAILTPTLSHGFVLSAQLLRSRKWYPRSKLPSFQRFLRHARRWPRSPEVSTSMLKSRPLFLARYAGRNRLVEGVAGRCMKSVMEVLDSGGKHLIDLKL
ncbi:hypothetical protein BDN72DRAFT_300627 [Pluteus cervinus]|uniref:Uncharacterized protein n=1 Tax=Pluteus cervinus TaxID=181527 RepID=A0ACD3ADR1_9AGAR|nr:hypothetical protein BDN72DRAFT_300627 [Pluteus cervinus]